MRLFPAALLACALACVPAARAATDSDSSQAGPVFTITPTVLRATPEGEWLANMTLSNPTQWGLYPDSLSLAWTREDPDSSTEPRHGIRNLAQFVRLTQPASSGESTGLEWSAPAEFDRGTLVFTIWAHNAQHQRYARTQTVQVTGSDLSDLYPPLPLVVNGHAVDLVFIPADSTVRPAPVVFYVPPSGTAARSLIRWSLPHRQRGFAVGVMSLPGTGRSTGVADAAGPASVAALSAAIDRVEHEVGVDRTRFVLWGQEDGATTALLAAARHPELAGVIAVDAWYDPWAVSRALSDSARSVFVARAGRDSAAWQTRSPLAVAARIKPPVLVLQSAESRDTTDGARAFGAERASNHLYVESRLNGTEPRPLHRRETPRVALDFLQRRTKGPR